MASSAALGSPLWADGMSWSSLLSRQLAGGVAVWDTNASSTAVNPLGGVLHGPAKPLAVAPLAVPGMFVLVNAGYVAVPHPTPQNGVYLFGLTAQATLTVAANVTGSSRTDIVVARVRDLGTTGSYADIEIVTGTAGAGQPATPAVSLLLGTVTVAPSATSIAAGNITDTRTFTVAPGGILPVTTTTAPPLSAGQIVWNMTTATLDTLAPSVTYTQTFTTSTSWIAPFTGLVYDQNTGGGGGGGGGFQNNTDGNSQGGAGGGGAEYTAGWLPVTKGHSYPVTIGSAGTQGTAGSNNPAINSHGSPGTAGTATITVGDTGTVNANGGQGGEGGGVNYPDIPGAGGTGSAGTVERPGGTGGPGSYSAQADGGGGGAAGSPNAPGGAGIPGHAPGGGQGGQAGPGGGKGGNGAGTGGFGGVGGFPGGGGGGGFADNVTYWNAGGNGGGGQCVRTWTIQPAALTPVLTSISGPAVTPGEYLALINTDTGTGLNPGDGSTYGWGIGYGTAYGSTDGQVASQIGVSFVSDGNTDYQIDARWGIAIPEAAIPLDPSIPRGQCRIIVYCDEQVLDQVFLRCAASGGVTQPGDSGSFTVYTSSRNGTTPGAGSHTITLAVETLSTLSGSYSGAHIGDLASVGTSPGPFGTALPSPYLASLVAEQSYLRVAGIAAS